MQFKLSVLYTLASLLLSASAASVPDLVGRDSKVVLLDFEKVKAPVNGLSISKRSNVYPADLLNEGIFYLTYLEIGSDKQRIGVDVDTGSSNSWVPDTNGIQAFDLGWPFGSYSPRSSTSAKDLLQIYAGSYVDGSSTVGVFFEDTVRFGSSGIINNFQFADIIYTGIPNGILGIGPQALEDLPNEYPNFVERLKSDGTIAKKAFSVYLNEPDATSGTILFGGKDLDKIDGELATQQVTDTRLFSINLDSITVNGQTYNGGESVLDTGTTTLALTQELGDGIISQYDGGKWNDEIQRWLISPDANIDQPVTFNFNGISITTSLKNAYNPNIFDPNTGKHYGPGFNIIRYDFNLLGDIFLTNAYVVYDYEDSTISIGKPKYTSSSNIVAL